MTLLYQGFAIRTGLDVDRLARTGELGWACRARNWLGSARRGADLEVLGLQSDRRESRTNLTTHWRTYGQEMSVQRW